MEVIAKTSGAVFTAQPPLFTRSKLSASHRNCRDFAQVTSLVLNMASVWTLGDLSHMQVFIIDGPLGAWCGRGERGQVKNSLDTYHHLIQY